jgi:5-(carboxyamino)imidazole ribonucleotide synthase
VSAAPAPIAPPATIGMLGGGQLGRYALVAARLAGYRTIVLDPDPAAPAGRVADEQLVAAYDDGAALDELARRCAVVTTEFENPPASALLRLARDVVVAPAAAAVAIAQDRVAEKTALAHAGIPVTAFVALTEDADLAAATALGVPAIVKTARLGYDGKGQRVVDHPGGLAAAWGELDRVPSIVERRVDLDAEVSAVIARSADGAIATYPLAENVHVDGILDLTVVPARVDPAIAQQARRIATQVAEALDYVGILAVELFVSAGRLLVNELAPRPHNSGHWTLDAAQTSQFSQQIRAITGAALGATSMTVPAVAMVNLLGDLWFPPGAEAAAEPAWTTILTTGDARLHLYGKSTPRRGRKMGHVTVLGDDVDQVAEAALRLRAACAAKPNAGGVPRSATIR